MTVVGSSGGRSVGHLMHGDPVAHIVWMPLLVAEVGFIGAIGIAEVIRFPEQATRRPLGRTPSSAPAPGSGFPVTGQADPGVVARGPGSAYNCGRRGLIQAAEE